MTSPTTYLTRRLLPAVLALMLLVAACGGSDPGEAPLGDGDGVDTSNTRGDPAVDAAAIHGNAGESGTGTAGHHGVGGHGAPQELAEGVPVPTIAIEVTADPVEGWNLRIHTTDFLIAPENVSTNHIDGEGHMHLYVDGEKTSRIYGEWHHITGLDAGRHDVRVELSSNNHAALSIDGEIIDAAAEIFQGGRADPSLKRDEPVEAIEPHPSVSVRLVEDPAGGWSLHAVPSNFRLAPENASTGHVDGEGYMRLYVGGAQMARLYEPWFQMPPLAAGIHEIKVGLRTNDHAPLTVNGIPVETTMTLEVPADDATQHGHEHGAGHEHGHGEGHATTGAPTRYDADVADAVQTITIEAVDGEPVGDVQRVEVALGSVVGLMVASDVAEEVHVHGYDILRAVSEGHPAHFAFTAEIPGVFEVEFEGSGRLLMQLEIS